MNEHADVVVIGLGVGGEELVTRLARAGLSVVGVERRLVGGECPNWGCVPTKMLIRAANALAEAGRVDGLAGTAKVQPAWAPVARRIREEATDDWDDRAAVRRLEGQGVRVVRGTARLEGPGRVDVDGTVFEAARGVVVASGTAPVVPPVPGLQQLAWTNRDAVEAEEPPESLLVLGGGPIGLELTQVFARFGTTVTVVEPEDRVLASEDPEASDIVADVLRSEGVTIHTGAQVRSVRKDGSKVVAELDDGSSLIVERVLAATGRRADLAGLGVASVDLDEDADAIEVDGRMRAGERLWAIGDVTGVGPFTHVAVHQARIAADDILGRAVVTADYRALPRVTFTDPEVGSVGMSEKDARTSLARVRVGRAKVPESARGWIHKVGNDGLIKVVEDADRGFLVGAISVGPHGGEVLGMLTLAIHARVPTDDLTRMIYAYPTFHRGVEDALHDLHEEEASVAAR